VRLHELVLTRYGAFDGRAVDIGPGLTVIHGPNESGKSTFGVALADVLWGMQRRSHPYAFRVAVPQLRLDAVVSRPGHPDDQTAVIVDSRGHRGSDGAAIARWWGSGPVASREAWLTSLGLDRDRLRSGGRQVLKDGGDLAPLLFRARTGVDLDAARARLRAEADSLYKKHGGARKVAVRQAAAQVHQAQERVKEATSSAADVVRLREALDRASAEFEAVDRQYADLQRMLDQAEESVRAWEPLHALTAADHELAALRSQGRVLGQEDLTAYEKASAATAPLTGQLARLDARMERFQERLASLQVDDDALRVAERVEGLCDRRGVERQRVSRLESLRQRRDEQMRAVRGLVLTAEPSVSLAGDGSSPGDLVVAATALVIPADVIDRLDRDAQALRELEGDVDDARRELESAARRKDERGAGAAVESAGPSLGPARQARRRAWTALRDPWLAGDLPAEVDRRSMANDVEESTARVDSLSDEAVRAAESAGRLREADAQWARRAALLEDLEKKAEEVRARWVSVLEGAGLPVVLDPDAWDVRRAWSASLLEAVNQLDHIASEIGAETEAVAQFADQVGSVCTTLGIDTGDYWADLDQADERVEVSRNNQAAAHEIERELADAIEQKDAARAELAGHQAVLEGLTSDDDLATVIDRSQRVVDVLERRDDLRGRLRAAADPGTDLEELARRVGARALADLEAERDRHKEKRDDALARRDEANSARTQVKSELEAAERIGSAAELRALQREAAEVLAADVEEYVQVRLMLALMDRVLAAERPDEDNELIEQASELAARLTEGRVTGLSVEEVDGLQRLRIEADGLADGVHSELSEGTADQVFLALRLAGIRHLQEQSVASGGSALPVLLDDVLMAHDDARTEAALRVLAEQAVDQQIVLTTHHVSVADAARAAGATVVSLDPRPEHREQPVAPVRGAAGSVGGEPPDPGAVRAWAREEGIDVGERGRIKGWIVEAYLARDHPDHYG
jgi:uncharacterized protein YhaN